jgi:IS30 family transposase
MSYKHLTLEERYHIQAYKKAGYKQKEIAQELGVDPSTVSRELNRNSSKIYKRYTAVKANQVANDKRMYASRKSNKKMDRKLKKLIEKNLLKDWSPEQISARIKLTDNIDISFVRIYQFIEQDKQEGGDLYTHLRFHHTGHRRAKYGSRSKGRIKDRVSISQRDEIVDDKSRIGDWEIDTIVGAKQQGAITTVVERKTSLLRISIPTTKKAADIEAETIRIMSLLKDKIHTITSDNGLEFSNHKNISQALNYQHYFCHPYSSWERGLNEYTNGLIRQYIPKGTSFDDITPEYIKMIEDKLNNRPRKALNWKTPNEAFYGLKMAA